MFGKLAEAYFAPKSWEKSGRLYEFLGIRFFKKYLPTTGDLMMRYVWRTKIISGRSTKDVQEYEHATRVNEYIHLISAILFLYIYLLYFAPFILVMNLLLNIYPIMLQRYNRARIYRILEWRKNRELATVQTVAGYLLKKYPELKNRW